MTSEVAIVNRTAVALAADSALTVKNEKVWNNTNKLFSVSDKNDIGVMIFGSGSHCTVSWEIMIKRFRKYLGGKVFNKFDDCVAEFREFIEKFEVPNDGENELNVLSVVVDAVDDCCASLNGTKLDRRQQFDDAVDVQIEEVYERELVLNDYNVADFSEQYYEIIRTFAKEQAETHLTKPILKKLVRLCFERVCRSFRSALDTGVVFAGYGEQDIFPIVEHLVVDGVVDGHVRVWRQQKCDLNATESKRSYVMSFAQSDIAQLFMEGIQPEYLRFFDIAIEGLLNSKSSELIKNYVPADNHVVEQKLQEAENSQLVKSLMEEFERVRAEMTTQPMLRIVSSLPKEEMAAMAEAIVEVTSLKRKIDSTLETVGGPVDVALISKADGFVWIKRKHYFSTELNRDFIERRHNRYYGRENDERER
ncbi:hypothetical protein [Thalassospira sp.]|uniref:hypothetical protein n=1 Tax=Thalassospira sp. TaxID=1912094 RepID=UPI000C691ABC|nr:hypothetical protein [Thalassospira sp.]MAL40692.1 hypothetical protein [Thalassospira sp.]|tara:strand:- start:2649 stop:3911 length:1263 start_codon:yes stop_codon:yes gene_type:complete